MPYTPRPDFDREGIIYTDLMKPMYRKGVQYICKVVMHVQVGRYHSGARRIAITQREAEWAERCPPKGGRKFVTNGWESYYLFSDEDDARSFVDFLTDAGPKRERMIQLVCRAESAEAAAEMKRDRRVHMRDTLYFGRYGFVVVLKNGGYASLLTLAKEVQTRVPEMLSGDSARYRITVGSSIRVYLRDERDIVPVRLAFGEHVSGIERVVFRGLLRNAHGTSQGAGRQGSDPPRN